LLLFFSKLISLKNLFQNFFKRFDFFKFKEIVEFCHPLISKSIFLLMLLEYLVEFIFAHLFFSKKKESNNFFLFFFLLDKITSFFLKFILLDNKILDKNQ